MKERTESLKLVNAALKPLPSKKFFEGAVPLTPREEAGDNPGQGKTGSLRPRNDLLGPRAWSTHVGRDLPVCVPMFANYQSIVKSTLFQGGVRVVLQLEGSITGRLWWQYTKRHSYSVRSAFTFMACCFIQPWILEQRYGLETCVGVEPNRVEMLIRSRYCWFTKNVATTIKLLAV